MRSAPTEPPDDLAAPLSLQHFLLRVEPDGRRVPVPYKPSFCPGEIAEIFAVSVKTIYREIGDGNLRAVRVAGSLRVPLGELEAYLRRNQFSA